MSAYQDSGPISCSASVDTSGLKGKTAIVTGGASGIGKQYVQALAKAGAHVVIADLSEENGKKVQQETSGSTTFVRCDVTSWEDQLAVFKKAKEFSPNREIDIVVANAGISKRDEVFLNDIEQDEPRKPNIDILDINATGVIWTAKLAIFYFRKQNDTNKKDRTLILKASLAGYLDLVGAPQYTCSKFFVRGLMRSLRQSETPHGIRVNVIAPWYIHTPIIGDPMDSLIQGSGVTYAAVEDAAACLLKIASDQKINGRAFAIVPRDWEGGSSGYVDLDQDDFKKGTLWHRAQVDCIKPFQYAETMSKEGEMRG